jgi:phage gpG-like protein
MLLVCSTTEKMAVFINADADRLLEKEIRKRVAKLVFATHAHIVENTPVDTGRLRSSIIVEEKGEGFIIGTNVEYAEFVEQGMQPTVIRPKNKQALFWKGARHPVKKVNHPGFAGRGMFLKGINYMEANLDRFLRE